MADGPPTSRRMRRALTASLAVVALGVVAPLVAVPSPAAAAAGEGMEVLCSDAGYGCVAGTGYRGQSTWGANYFRTGHNCTSYVSFMLAQAGASAPWYPMGNASEWDDRGQGRVAVDDVPAPGAVAQWDGATRLAPGAAGHVAMVDEVGPDHIVISDDTGAGRTRRIRIHRGSAYWPTSFVHIRDRIPVPALAALVGDSLGSLRSAADRWQAGSTRPIV